MNCTEGNADVVISGNKPSRRPFNVLGLYPDELAVAIADLGAKPYAARQLFGWIYAKGVLDFEQMHNLSKELRRALAQKSYVERPAVLQRVRSREGRVAKYLLSLADRRKVECVLIGMRDKDTFCISSQVGCRFGCAFCATGRMGLKRNLTASEILGQVLFLRSEGSSAADNGIASSGIGSRGVATRGIGDNERAFNIVFMGMGEPLDNYDHVVKAIRIMEDPGGLAVGGRRITLSTCGLPHRIRDLAREDLGIGLALSLNATTDEARAELIPAAKKFHLKEIMESLRYFAERSGRRVTLEYVLIAGVNDKPADAKRLASIATSLPSKINLIALNPSPGLRLAGLRLERPTDEAVERFVQILYPRAPAVTLRKSKGGDILAACGQLGAEARKRGPVRG
ncbi:MAG: 23S rRNA (adenine(2503)-C(2))-methyltransferase RlmN [Candidatus Eisenbacteria bacterium]|nr:23S rRNA (adenine(2503)-C(2))-methyltransferase RlmN [Candidatus Eisenbacteria bacterium]